MNLPKAGKERRTAVIAMYLVSMTLYIKKMLLPRGSHMLNYYTIYINQHLPY